MKKQSSEVQKSTNYLKLVVTMNGVEFDPLVFKLQINLSFDPNKHHILYFKDRGSHDSALWYQNRDVITHIS